MYGIAAFSESEMINLLSPPENLISELSVEKLFKTELTTNSYITWF